MGLVEVLVSILFIALLVGAITAGVLTVTRASSAANGEARANVLVTGFGEALKQLSYRQCSAGDLATIYQAAYEDYDVELEEWERLVPAGATDMSVQVTGVDTVGGCVAGAGDSGQQILTIEVQANGVSRTAQVVKRDPDYVQSGPVARIVEQRVSATGDAQSVHVLSGATSTPLDDIIAWEWDCGPEGTLSGDQDGDPIEVECSYTASISANETRTATLTVTDLYGVANTTSATLTVPKANTARLGPKAKIAATPTSGNTNLTVTFSAAGSNSLDGSIVAYEWDFGDPLSGSENSLTTTTATSPTHVYRRGGSFTASLVVVDDVGLRSPAATITITATQAGPTPPTAEFTMSPNPAVAPQTVAFDGSASRTASGANVSSYLWDFGDGTTAPGATTTHRYEAAGTYLVRLTVTDGAGVTGTTTQSLVVGVFTRPPDFRMTDARGELAHSGDFYFAWTNVAGSAGDPVSYEIEVKAVSGCLAFGSKTRTVTAGAVGTVQTYDFKVDWPASNVCLGSTYEWRVRAKRVNAAEGTKFSEWSPYSSWTITHT
jgi:PKD repeat protein